MRRIIDYITEESTALEAFFAILAAVCMFYVLFLVATLPVIQP